MKQPVYEKPEGRDAGELLTEEDEAEVELLTAVERVVAEEIVAGADEVLDVPVLDADVVDSEVLTAAEELPDGDEEEEEEEEEVVVLETT